MRYPLPHSYSFQIRRVHPNSPANGNPMIEARILSPEKAIEAELFAYDVPFERPTSKKCAGHVLFHMLYDIQTQIRLGDAYTAIHDAALDMAGLKKTLCQSLARE